jgi:hypothetical protein
MSSVELPPSVLMSTSAAASAFGLNGPQRSCGSTATNFGHRGVSGGLGRLWRDHACAALFRNLKGGKCREAFANRGLPPSRGFRSSRLAPSADLSPVDQSVAICGSGEWPVSGRVSDAGPARAVSPVRGPAHESHRRTNPRRSGEDLAVYGDLVRLVATTLSPAAPGGARA